MSSLSNSDMDYRFQVKYCDRCIHVGEPKDNEQYMNQLYDNSEIDKELWLCPIRLIHRLGWLDMRGELPDDSKEFIRKHFLYYNAEGVLKCIMFTEKEI